MEEVMNARKRVLDVRKLNSANSSSDEETRGVVDQKPVDRSRQGPNQQDGTSNTETAPYKSGKWFLKVKAKTLTANEPDSSGKPPEKEEDKSKHESERTMYLRRRLTSALSRQYAQLMAELEVNANRNTNSNAGDGGQPSLSEVGATGGDAPKVDVMNDMGAIVDAFVVMPLVVLVLTSFSWTRPGDVYAEDKPRIKDVLTAASLLPGIKYLMERLKKETKAKWVLGEAVKYTVFLTLVTIVAYGHFSSTEVYRLNTHLKQVLADAAVGGAEISLDSKSDIKDGATKKKPTTIFDDCPWHKVPDQYQFLRQHPCLPTATLNLRETRSFARNWSLPNGTEAASAQVPVKPGDSRAWSYQTSYTLKELPTFGSFGVYEGGGYVITLPGDGQESRKLLEDMKKAQWVDVLTRAVMVTFCLYTPNRDFISSVKVLFELTEYSKVAPKLEVSSTRLHYYNDWLEVTILACEISFVVMVMMYAYDNLKRMMELGARAFFFDPLNWAHMGIVLFAFPALGLHVERLYRISLYINEMKEHNFKTHVSFDKVAEDSEALLAAMGFVIWVVVLNMCGIMRFLPYIQITTSTFATGWPELTSVSAITMLSMVTCSYTSYIFFHARQRGFRTFYDSYITMTGYLMGVGATVYTDENSQYELYTVSFMFVFTLKAILLSLIGAVVLEAFEVTRQLHNFNKEETYLMNYVKQTVYHYLKIGPRPELETRHPDL
nr:hypothetical protein BaRGS_011566 [Batillaria attramentaria]